jgi:hypothetical protein
MGIFDELNKSLKQSKNELKEAGFVEGGKFKLSETGKIEYEKLIESGFDYVTEMDGIKLFRKRK